MKTLLLMRHAKSSWKIPDLPDQDRPLNKRGLRDAPMMGHLLIDRELIPQRILSSSAVRAQQTAEAVLKVIASEGREASSKATTLGEPDSYAGQAPAKQITSEVICEDRLYMAELNDYIEALRKQPDEIERLMIIGHNPGLETLLQMLSGRIESLPTAVIGHIALPIARWSDLSGDTMGELVDLWRPNELRDEEPAPDKPAKKARSGKEKGKSAHKHKDKKK